MLNDVPTEMMARVLEGPRADLVLIPCKSARLNWPTVETILRHRPLPRKIGEQTLAQANRDYRRLSRETAHAPSASGSCITGSKSEPPNERAEADLTADRFKNVVERLSLWASRRS